MEKVRIGVVGVGAISGIYLENITARFRELEIVGVCDLIDERTRTAVEKYRIPKQYPTMHDLFADPAVDIVLNLTRPYEHFEVSRAALLAGKHVYSEKPLAADLAEGRELVRLAEEKGLLLGGAAVENLLYSALGLLTGRPDEVRQVFDGYLAVTVSQLGYGNVLPWDAMLPVLATIAVVAAAGMMIMRRRRLA